MAGTFYLLIETLVAGSNKAENPRVSALYVAFRQKAVLYENKRNIWLKMAECHGALKDLKNSIHAYYQVLALEPLQIAVRFKLSVLLRASGREDEALSLLAGEKFI